MAAGLARATRLPSLWGLAEPWRAAAEFASGTIVAPMLSRAPRGDGHPVMVLPGFVTSDGYTVALRSYLRGLGYDAYAWELGLNLGPRSIGENGALLSRRIVDVYAATGRKLSLIGWSLGGLMARAAAHKHPEMVRQLICLGSPLRGTPRATRGWRFYEWMTGQSVSAGETRRQLAELRRPVSVPSTAIYSRSDGVTRWRDCMERRGRLTDNIEVHGSHWGLVSNPAVFYAIADRLALPEHRWRPFDRTGWRSIFYPAPDSGTPTSSSAE